MQERSKSISKMNQDQKTQQLQQLRRQKNGRMQRLRQSVSKIPGFVNKAFQQPESKVFQYVQSGIQLLPDSESKSTFSKFFKQFYDKYKQSKWKWAVRMIVGALVFYILGQLLLYYGGEWLASTQIVQKCALLLEYLGPIVRVVSSGIGGIINVFWNWVTGQ